MATTQEIERRPGGRVVPRCSIHEEEGKVVLVLEMPGVAKEDVSIRVENDELQVLGRRQVQERTSKYLVHERRIADFASSYTLDDTIDRDRIEAECSHGMLAITLHLKEASKPKQITVKEVR